MTLRFDSAVPDPGLIAGAADIIARGGLVVFPTETVYGIGADIRSPDAMERVARLKRRPLGQPLLVHCADDSQLAGLVAEVPASARRLMEEFWPGPLALVFKAKLGLPSAVTSRSGTVGIRMVAHPVFCALIAKLGSPLAGTSANLHGKPPTSDFSQIEPELLERLDVALDAGKCGTDTASTVLDVSCSPPVLLREGAVPRQTIEGVLGFNLATATRKPT